VVNSVTTGRLRATIQ